MRRAMRRTGVLGVLSVLLAGWLSVVSPAWGQVPAVAPGVSARDPVFEPHLPWIFRERSQSVLDDSLQDAVGMGLMAGS